MVWHLLDLPWPGHDHHILDFQEPVGHGHGHVHAAPDAAAHPVATLTGHEQVFKPHHHGHRGSFHDFVGPGPASVEVLPGSSRTSAGAKAAASFLQGPTVMHTPAHSSGSSRGRVGAGAAAVSFLTRGWEESNPSVSSATAFLFKENSKGLLELVQAAPPQLLVPLHTASVMFAVPGHLAFELGEGYLFGFRKGLMLAFFSKSLAAVLAFAVSRGALDSWGLRDRLRNYLQTWPSVNSATDAAEENGGVAVFMVRVAPVPCFIKNYALPILTDIPAITYIPATLAGLAPTTAAHVYAGTLAPTAADLASPHGAVMRFVATFGMIGAAGALSLLAGFALKSMGKKEGLEEKVQEAEKEEDDEACKQKQ